MTASSRDGTFLRYEKLETNSGVRDSLGRGAWSLETGSGRVQPSAPW